MKRKILTIFVAIMGVIAPLMVITAAESVYADDDDVAHCCREILGLKPWYCNVSKPVSGKCEIESPKGDEKVLRDFIVKIAGNVLSDLFVVVAYISIGFIIYSGFLYITSDGNPAKAAKAQKSLAGSIIGLVASVAATAIVRFVIEILVRGGSDIGGMPKVEVTTLVNNGFNTAYGIAGLAAVGFIVYSGVVFMTSSGDVAKVNKARKMLVYSIIGLVVILLAFAITTFVINAL